MPMTSRSLFARLEHFILQRYARWLDNRIPPRREITLVQNNIFIYPNWQFIYYFIVVMALWLAATNYENNLAFGLCFLMLAIFIVCILHTFNNLSGLVVTVIGVQPVFVDEYAEVEVLLGTGEHKPRDALNLYWDKEHSVTASLVDVPQQRIKVPVKVTQRGLFNPRRMTLDTVYPLGIIRGVSYLDLDIQILAYPKPILFAPLVAGTGEASEGEQVSTQRGSDEYSHLREYQPGDALKQVAWKQLAKGRDMQVKEYADYVQQHHWLDWDGFSTLPTEKRLSNLCYWALQLDKQDEVYGLKLPGNVIAPNSGAHHLQQVLTALAMVGVA
jgi:uncharacterized protein (DUF58 family)